MTMPGLATSYDDLMLRRDYILSAPGVNIDRLIAPIEGKEIPCESDAYERFDQKALPPEVCEQFKQIISITKNGEKLTALLAEDIKNMAAAEGYNF